MESMEEYYHTLNDPEFEIEQVEAKISEASEITTALEPWKAWERAQEEISEAGLEIGAANEQIALLRAEKRELLAGAGIPVRGLTFTDEGDVQLYGRALDVASGRQWVDFEVDVAVARDQDLRAVLIDEADNVDPEGMAALCEDMERHDLTAFVSRIEPSGAGEVIVCSGGRAWNVVRKTEPSQ